MDVMNRLHMLRESLIAARDCVQPAETQIPQHVAGLRAGLEIAVKAVTEEIKWAELDEQDAKRISGVIESKEAIQEQYRKATEPYSGTLRIDATPEELAKRQRMIDNGEVPF